MERSVWTDERIDDMAARNDSQFELIMAEFREVHTELRELRAAMVHGWVALFAVLASMYATVLVLALS